MEPFRYLCRVSGMSTDSEQQVEEAPGETEERGTAGKPASHHKLRRMTAGSGSNSGEESVGFDPYDTASLYLDDSGADE